MDLLLIFSLITIFIAGMIYFTMRIRKMVKSFLPSELFNIKSALKEMDNIKYLKNESIEKYKKYLALNLSYELFLFVFIIGYLIFRYFDSSVKETRIFLLISFSIGIIFLAITMIRHISIIMKIKKITK